MANKKIPISFNPAEVELEKRVDEMMEPARKTPLSAPPIDIFSDPKTAPQVPDGLVDKLDVKTKAEPKKISVLSHDADGEADIPADDKEEPTAEPIVVSTVPSAPELPAESSSLEEVVTIPEETPETEAVDEKEEESVETDTEPEFVPPVISITPEPQTNVPQLVKYPAQTIIPKNNLAAEERPVVNDIMVPPLKIDDSKSDAAVADIAAKEGDELLAAQDQLQNATVKKAAKPRRRFPKRWLLLAVLLAALIAAAAVPTSRYKVAGLVVKKDLQVKVMDSKSQTPVSKAEVVVHGQQLQTDANGLATLRVGVGNHPVVVSKQYYAAASTAAFVDFTGDKPLVVNLVATGRQVPITVIDTLTDKPVAGAEISILNTNAKTDSKGRALIVLPTKTPTVDGTIKSGKFNTSKVKVAVTNADVPENTFRLTPSGKVYFLSNEDGTIDVVKANLDGTGRKTVLKGTGKEDGNSTVLLASRDWRFAVLKAQRNTTQASLFLLDTSTDKVTEFDSGDASFTPIGWSGHNFLYDVVRNSVAVSQTGHELIKSYDADRLQLNQLDQSQAEGDDTTFSYQGFYNFNIVDNLLVYNSQWYSSGGADLSKKNNAIRGVQANGQNKKDYQTFSAAGMGYIQAVLAKPQEVYFGAYNFQDSKTLFYEFKNGAVKESTAVNQASFNKLYPAYVMSPLGQQVAWSELRDGKQVVILADASGNNQKLAGSLAGYKVYGWFDDSYLLVSKNNSELYIAASTGDKAPIKLTDYYKPSQNQGSYGNF